MSDARLHDLATRLGSDVPFFLRGGCAIGRGRGDLLEPLPLPAQISGSWSSCQTCASRPRRPASTRASSAEDFSDGSRIAAQAARLRSGLAPDMTLLGNAFARPLYAMVPELAALPDIMRDAGAESVAISGAGPAHYTLVTAAPRPKQSRRASASGSVTAPRSSSPGQ